MDLLLYGLADPNTDELRYVGLSSTGMTRPQRHSAIAFRAKKLAHLPVYCWIRDLVQHGTMYKIVVLDDTIRSVAALRSAERHWIAVLRALGSTLLNVSSGGLGGPLAPSSRARISAANRSRIHTAQSRANNAAAQRIAQNQPAALARNRERGRRLVLERPDIYEKLLTAARGPRSQEHREKIAAAVRASMTPERRAQSAAGRRGKSHSAESRAKISAARRERERARKARAV